MKTRHLQVVFEGSEERKGLQQAAPIGHRAWRRQDLCAHLVRVSPLLLQMETELLSAQAPGNCQTDAFQDGEAALTGHVDRSGSACSRAGIQAGSALGVAAARV